MKAVTFEDCVKAALSEPKFIQQWCRLRNITLPNTPLERLIDSATGNEADIASRFLCDVYDLIWLRLSSEVKQ